MLSPHQKRTLRKLDCIEWKPAKLPWVSDKTVTTLVTLGFLEEKQDESHWFNNDPKCYADPPGNTLRFTPDRFPQIRQHQAPQLNAAVTKDFNLTERFRLNLRGEGFNVTNTPIRTDPNTTRTSADFGKLGFSQKNFPRFFQLAAKFYF